MPQTGFSNSAYAEILGRLSQASDLDQLFLASG